MDLKRLVEAFSSTIDRTDAAKMASDVEDDDLDNLRKAALATLKPKAQPISSISSVPRADPQPSSPWLEFPLNDGILPEVFSNYQFQPEPQPMPQPMPHLRQNVSIPPPPIPRGHLPQPGWPLGFNYMIQGQKSFQPRGFFADRRPFNMRAHHRSFGDRGRPMRDRGRHHRRGYVPDQGRGFFSRGRGRPTAQRVDQFAPAKIESPGGNLIDVMNLRLHPTEESRNNTTDNVNNNGLALFTCSLESKLSLQQESKLSLPRDKYHSSTSSAANSQVRPALESKLSLPQDKYHSTTSSAASDKISRPSPPPKPRDKFSRYEDSDSEEDDDWIDSLIAADTTKIDELLQDGEGQTDTRVVEQTEGSYEVEIRKLDLSDNEEEDSGRHGLLEDGCSPVTSDNESVDLDALAGEDDLAPSNKGVVEGDQSPRTNHNQVSLLEPDQTQDKEPVNLDHLAGEEETSNVLSTPSSTSSSSSSSSSSSGESSSEEDDDEEVELNGVEPVKESAPVGPPPATQEPMSQHATSLNDNTAPLKSRSNSPPGSSTHKPFVPTARRSPSPQRARRSPRQSRSISPVGASSNRSPQALSYNRSISPVGASSNRSPQALSYNRSISPRMSHSPKRVSPRPYTIGPRSPSPHRSLSPRQRSPSSRRPLSPRRSPLPHRPLSPRQRSPSSGRPLSPRQRSPSSRRPLSPRRSPLSHRPLSPRQRSPSSRRPLSPRRSPLPHRPLSPRQRSPSSRRPLSPRQRSPSSRRPLSPRQRSPSSRRPLSPRQRSPSSRRPLSPRQRSPSSRRPLSPRRSPLPHRSISPRRSPLPLQSLSPRRRSPLPLRSLSPRRRSPLPLLSLSPRRRSPLPLLSLSPRRRSPLPLRRRSTSAGRSLSPGQRSSQRLASPPQRSVSPRRHFSPRRSASPTRRKRSPVKQPVLPRHLASPLKQTGYPRNRDVSRHRAELWSRDYRASWHEDGPRYASHSLSSYSMDRAARVDRHSRPTRKHTQPSAGLKDKNRQSPQKLDKRPLVKESQAEAATIPAIDLDKLAPEERAKIEARRKKFCTSEVKIDPAKTVSLKSIKERTKKRKKVSELAPEKRAKGSHKKENQSHIAGQGDNSSSGEDEENKSAALDDDSDDSDAGRHWKLEGSKAGKQTHRLNIPGRSNHSALVSQDQRSRQGASVDSRSKHRHRERRVPGERLRERRPPVRPRVKHRNEAVSEDDSDETVGPSRLTSSIASSQSFMPDIPPEKLHVKIRVASSDRKSKKSKVQPDFSHVYSVPAKQTKETAAETKVTEALPVVLPKKAKKKKKEKKKTKHEKELPEEDLPTEAAVEPPAPRLSVLDRLGKKVPFKPHKEKKKKKRSHADEEDPSELDVKIRKIKEKNAAIARRQQEIELDKKKYG